MEEPKVTVYSTNWCAFCHTEKEWLASLGVQFVSKNIEDDLHAKDEMLEKVGGTWSGVPVTDINGNIVIGFNRPELEKLLTENNLIPTNTN